MTCDACGNDYKNAMQIEAGGKRYTFDCFECAIHLLAPHCEHCGIHVIGHGVEEFGMLFCCDHCAREQEHPVRQIELHSLSATQKGETKMAGKKKRTAKTPSARAGRYVREEIKDLRKKGKKTARSRKQAIAIGLSRARRAGIPVPPPRS